MPARLWLITTFGLGFMRPASGTWGSLPPVGLAALLVLTGVHPATPWLWFALLGGTAVLFSLACLAHGDFAEAHFRRKDPGQVVADETAGMALTLLFLPPFTLTSLPRAAAWLALCFILFRLTDILKPPPCRGLQRLHAGWGILIDDLIAAVYAGVIVHLAAAFWAH